MKLKNYRELFESESDDQIYGRPNYSNKSIHSGYDPDEEESEIPNEDMDHLVYLLRSLFRNSGIDASISYKNLDINIMVDLNKREKLSNILRVFDVVKKLKKDILLQYECEFELWEAKGGQPILTFNFSYNEGISDSDEPF